MKYFFNNLKIKYKLLLIYSSVFLVILFTSGYIIYSNVKVQIENQIVEELTRSIDSITNTIDALSKDNSKKRLEEITTKNRQIMDYYYNLYKNGEISKKEALEDLDKFFSKQKIGKSGYLAVTHNDKKNKKYIIITHPFLSKNEDVTNLELVQKIMSMKEGYYEYLWKNKTDKTYRKKVMYTTYFKPWNYAITATAYLDEISKIINVTAIQENIKSYKIGSTGFIYIINSKSNIIYHPTIENGKSLTTMNEELIYIYKRIIHRKNGRIYYDWDNQLNKQEKNIEKKIALFRYIPQLDWYITASVYLNEYNQPLKKLESAFITSFILLTIFMLIVTFWVSSYITQPLYDVINKLKQAKQNDFRDRLVITSDDELGELVKHYNIFLDELEIFSSKLAETAHKFHSILDNTTAIIYIKDIEGKYELINKQYEKVFNLKEKEILGKNDSVIFNKSIAKQLKLNDLEVIRKGSSISIEENVNINNKIYSYISVKFPLFDDNNKIISICGISTEITEIKNAEERIITLNKNLEYEVTKRTSELLFSNMELENTIANLEKTQDQLIHSEKMASLGDLVAGVAHEINTPVGLGVTGISHLEFLNKGIKELYDDDNLSQEEFEEYIKNSNEMVSSIHTNLNRAASLIKSFKQVAVDQSFEISRVFNVKEYINETLMSLHFETKRLKHKFVIDCDENINIISHPGPFSQIITNLVMNSIIHGFKNIESGVIGINVKELNGELILIYTDDGIGIKKENLSKIYDPFFTTNRNHGGSGLGLNIIYNIVTSTLMGKINCESKVDEGVKFTINIPIEIPS